MGADKRKIYHEEAKKVAAEKRFALQSEISTLTGRSMAVADGLVAGRQKRLDKFLLNVRPDQLDGRDQIYSPGLTEIKPFLAPPRLFFPTIQSKKHANKALGKKIKRARRKLIRRQGSEGSCTGQALAACIDVQKLLRNSTVGQRTLFGNVKNRSKDFDKWWESRTSARMLYEMARTLDDDPEDRIPGSTIRNVLKAFRRNGVCIDQLAPYDEGEPGWFLRVNQAKDARKTSIGSYFRIKPELYHYHAALNETGAILVSAMIHSGWQGDRIEGKPIEDVLIDRTISLAVKEKEEDEFLLGEIIRNPAEGFIGAHAFVIVGYSDTGFFVLNSWGHTWGMVDVKDPLEKTGIPGIAHWPYLDWQESVLDAWTFRLAIGSETTFMLRGGFGKNTESCGLGLVG